MPLVVHSKSASINGADWKKRGNHWESVTEHKRTHEIDQYQTIRDFYGCRVCGEEKSCRKRGCFLGGSMLTGIKEIIETVW